MAHTYKKIGNRYNRQLKEGIKNIIRKLLKEEGNAIMRTKLENDKIENVLNKNIGIPFDTKEKQEIVFKQGVLGIKSTIQRNGTEIKFSTSDMFGNNKINVIKKLKNMSDANTLVYANFFSSVQTDSETPETPEAPAAGQPSAPAPEKEPSKTYVKLSQPFEDKGSEKLDILGDFMQQLDK